MNRPDQRIRNTPLIKTGSGPIYFHKLGIFFEGGKRIVLGFLQNQPGRRGLTYSRRPVNNHMLRIGTAKGRPEGFQTFFLADNLLKLTGPSFLA
jgi:hypothetical protein